MVNNWSVHFNHLPIQIPIRHCTRHVLTRTLILVYLHTYPTEITNLIIEVYICFSINQFMCNLYVAFFTHHCEGSISQLYIIGMEKKFSIEPVYWQV